MTEWTRTPPTEAGWYWLADDHWSDAADPELLWVHTDNDGALKCIGVGWAEPLAVSAMKRPAYWTKAALPKPPVFSNAA